jgi:hypothetical protein
MMSFRFTIGGLRNLYCSQDPKTAMSQTIQTLMNTQLPVSSFLSQNVQYPTPIQLPASKTLVSDRPHLKEIINRLNQRSNRSYKK